ncbi:MAG: DNA-binding response regulator [Gammaproteobacteria bacterium]|nr:MAG: DNA-binding response regulator [Gammaproteobacteria bacterium]
MKLLIVDDEPLARERLRALVAELDLDAEIAEAGTGEVALRAVAEQGADVVLLDIRMPGMDGLEAARHLDLLEQPPAVIFTTAYDRHALDAFDACAVDYLLKPIRKERLQRALARAGRLSTVQLGGLKAAVPDAAKARTHITASMRGKLHIIPVAEVRYFRAEQKYVTVNHPRGQILIEDSLHTLEEEFGERFLRVHRNALVAPQHVVRLEKDEVGHYCVYFRGVDGPVEVSRRLVAGVKRVLKGA